MPPPRMAKMQRQSFGKGWELLKRHMHRWWECRLVQPFGVCLAVCSNMILGVGTLDHLDLPCLGVFAIEMCTYIGMGTKMQNNLQRSGRQRGGLSALNGVPPGTWNTYSRERQV